MDNNDLILVGMIEAVFYENPSNFYKVMRVSINHEETDLLLGNEIVVTGQFATIQLDTEYQFFGNITNHPKYGEQFTVARYQQITPSTREGLIDYLSSHRFKGIGKVLAERIVDKLGQDAIDTIIESETALKSIKGLTKSTASSLRKALIEHQGTERIFMQLNLWGFGASLADKIYRKYESKTLDIIKENPYQLVEDIDGIGFNKADKLAEEQGIDALSLDRIVAGLYTATLEMSSNEGDTYISYQDAIVQARKILESSRRQLIDDELILKAIERAIDKKVLIKLVDTLMIPSLYFAEIGIVNRLNEYLMYEDVERFSETEIEQALKQVIKNTGINYDEDQQTALKVAINSPMSVITGGPGTGKTTLIKGLIGIHSILHDYDLEKASKSLEDNPILLAAPTGRAAKRMKETTGLPASTIHRLIGYSRETIPEDYLEVELDGALLIVDEMSMVDTWLMNWLIQAIPYHMQVIFVGDKDQLPSVGPGKVFSDLIESNVISVLSLKKIYRQKHNSSIIELAHTIRQGQLPDNFLVKQSDRTFIKASSLQVGPVIKQIVDMASKKGFNANNLQVLAPMYKGPAGINSLNELLQELMNPKTGKKRELAHFDTIFRVGDKVLQLVNNAEEDVYNGDIGLIESIHFKDETESKNDEMVVSFDDDKELTYKKSELDQLTLAYCTSIHKAQGSEYELVILPLIDSYSRLLQKDLLYTAVTRAQKSLIMIGNPDSFLKAVSGQRRPRNTFLADLLKVQFDKEGGEVLEEDKEALEETVKIPKIANDGVLTAENIMLIDPMINMEGLSPYDL